MAAPVVNKPPQWTHIWEPRDHTRTAPTADPPCLAYWFFNVVAAALLVLSLAKTAGGIGGPLV